MVQHHYSQATVVADATALDFVNSVPSTTDGIDPFCDGDRLLDWLGEVKLVPHASLQGIRQRTSPGELNKIAERARDLRDWFLTFVRKNMGQPLPSSAHSELAPLNQLLESSVSYNQVIQVSAENGSFALRANRSLSAPDSLLEPIAETLAKFVCDEDFSNVKMCEGHGCSRLFADRTRRHSRRWCSMAVCGNRAKVQAHRDRARLAQSPEADAS